MPDLLIPDRSHPSRARKMTAFKLLCGWTRKQLYDDALNLEDIPAVRAVIDGVLLAGMYARLEAQRVWFEELEQQILFGVDWANPDRPSYVGILNRPSVPSGQSSTGQPSYAVPNPFMVVIGDTRLLQRRVSADGLTVSSIEHVVEEHGSWPNIDVPQPIKIVEPEEVKPAKGSVGRPFDRVAGARRIDGRRIK